MIDSSWSTSGTSRVSLVASQVISLIIPRGNKKPTIAGQTIKWPEVKGLRDNQWSTNHFTER